MRNSLTVTTVVMLLTATGCGPKPADTEAEAVIEVDKSHPDFKNILGTWVIVSSERFGEPNETAVGNRYTFREDKLSAWLQEFGDFNVDYTIDPTKDPKNFDFELGSEPSIHRGIYQLDGDTLRLCFLTRNRPTSFKTKEGDPWVSHVLERSADQD